MKKLITTMVMLAILVFALSTSVQAYSMSYAGTKTEVESGETFNVVITVDEPTTLANGHLSYNSSLFTFVSASQDNMSAEGYPSEGKVKWMYADLPTDATGTKTFTFTFKAAEVTETKKGTFTLNDFVVETTADKEYAQDANTVSGSKSVDVTIKKKVETPNDNWTIDPSKDFELSIGETKQIKTDGEVTWSTSDSKIATVDKDGNVKGIGKGTATITAKDKDGNIKTVKVTVKDITWKLDPSGDLKLTVGDKKQIKADEDVTWSSSNSKVVTVDKKGNVVAVGAGTATITATDKFGNTRTIKVTVVSKTAGTKDNTTTPDKKLPQTGEDFTRFACLAIAGIVLATGLVFKKKAKNLNKLFVILPLVAALSISGAVNAIKLVDDTKMKAGIFDRGTLLEDIGVIAVSPCKDFKTEDFLTVETLNEILGESSSVSTLEDAKGNTMELTATAIPTGAVVGIAGEGESSPAIVCDYTVLLYGDANGDGKICNSLDVNVIRQDYVFNNKAEGVYKKAADLYADDVLNVRDVQRMVKKYLGKLDGSLVTPFPGEKNIVLNPSEDITLKVGDTSTITAKDEDGKDIAVKWTSSNPEVATVDQNGKITAVGPGTTTITATDENGNEQSIEVTVVDKEAVKPEFTVDVKTNGNVATVTVDVTNKAEIEKDSKIKSYNYTVVKIPTGPNQSAQTVANVSSEEPTYTFENLEDGAYQVVVAVATEKGAHETVTKSFTIKNSSDGVTTDKTKAVAYAYYATEEKGNEGPVYFTSLQSAVNYVKNNVVQDHLKHVAEVGLLKDVTESIVINDEINTNSYWFNLNGHTITGKEAGNTITIQSPNVLFIIDNYEFDIDKDQKNSNTKKTTGGVNATETEGDSCIYLEGTGVTLNVEENVSFAGLTQNSSAIKTNKDYSGTIRIENMTWNTNMPNCLFIDDLGSGGIQIKDGTYKGYTKIIKQAGDGNIYIGNENKEISETEPEKATPRLEAHDSIIDAPNSRIVFNYGYLSQRNLNVDGFTLRKDTNLYKTVSEAYYVVNNVPQESDGVTTDKTKAVAYAYYATEETGNAGPVYFTSLQSAVNYVKNNVVQDHRTHTATIGLLKDTTESIVIDDEINDINLNLNGYALTGAKAGNTITVNSPTIHLFIDNHEFDLEKEQANSNNKKTTGGINASGAEGDNCIYLAGKNVYFNIYEHMTFGGLTTNGTVIKTAQDTTTTINIYNTTWETGDATCVFIDDLGSGGIQIKDGTYKGYSKIIKQAGAGNIYIGTESQAISEDEPEKATPRLEARDSIIDAPNSRIVFNYGYLSQRNLNVDGFTLRKDANLYQTPSEVYYVVNNVELHEEANEVVTAGTEAVSDIVNN